MDSKQLTAKIKGLLKLRYSDKGWIYYTELATEASTGYGTRYIDFYTISTHKSKGYRRVACEVKVSRGDFMNEIKNPAKRELAVKYSTEFYFVTPQGLLKPEEIPVECGLMEMTKNGDKLRIKKRATQRQDAEFPMWFAISVLKKEFYRDKKERRKNEEEELDLKLFKYAGREMTEEEFKEYVDEQVSRYQIKLRHDIDDELMERYVGLLKKNPALVRLSEHFGRDPYSINEWDIENLIAQASSQKTMNIKRVERALDSIDTGAETLRRQLGLEYNDE